MNDTAKNQQYADALKSLMMDTAELIVDAMDRQTGVYSQEDIFNAVRPAMPNAADLGVLSATDQLIRIMIESIVDLKTQLPATVEEADNEIAMIERIQKTMKQHGFKTAGEALDFLQKQQLN